MMAPPREARTGALARTRKGERGVALLLAMFALLVLGGLAGAVVLVAGQQRLLGRNLLRRHHAFTVAETAAEDLAPGWRAGPYAGLSVGGTVTMTGPGYGGWYRRTIERLSPTVFLVKAEGFSPDSTSRQAVGLLLRLQPVPITLGAALTTRGQVTISDPTRIDGSDAVPGAWPNCPPPGTPLPAVRTPDPGEVTYLGCETGACLSGSELVLADPALEAEPFPVAGGLPLDSLRRLADKVLAGGGIRVEPRASGSACDTADPYNWGDPESPSGPCGDYFPIVWVDGHAGIYGVRGQGILLVRGNLSLRGGFKFHGPVIVGGTLDSEGAGGQIVGGAVVVNGNRGRSTLIGEGGIAYSSCAVARALVQSAKAAAVTNRAWVHLY